MDTEETRETHNLYIERTRGSLKNICIYFLRTFFKRNVNLLIYYNENTFYNTLDTKRHYGFDVELIYSFKWINFYFLSELIKYN